MEPSHHRTVQESGEAAVRPDGLPPVSDRSREVKRWALHHGFDACGIATAQDADPADNLGAWLARGFHADMLWMARTQRERQDIQLRLPGARSVIVVAKNYYAGDAEPPSEPAGRVARYAWGRDYHRALRKPLKRLAQDVVSLEAGAQYSLSIDSSPVLERTWAERAGVGWVGKNSLMLRRDLGSYFFLAVILTTVELEADAPVAEACGSCRACLDACPTGAIVEAKVVDSNRCISYQTIENRQEIPMNMQSHMGDWLFGCDICQHVCPWNRFAVPNQDPDFQAGPNRAFIPVQSLLDMDAAAFEESFSGTPIRRTRLEGIRRNARIVAANVDSQRSHG